MAHPYHDWRNRMRMTALLVARFEDGLHTIDFGIFGMLSRLNSYILLADMAIHIGTKFQYKIAKVALCSGSETKQR